jgi:hypothetical protein
MKYPIPRDGDLASTLVQDVAQMLAAHGYPQPDVDDLPRLSRVLSTFLHGPRPGTQGRTITLVDETSSAAARRSGHLVVAGGEQTGKTNHLIQIVRRHLDDQGDVWVYADPLPAGSRWQELDDLVTKHIRAETLARDVHTLVATIQARIAAQQDEESTSPPPPILLVLDELPAGMADDDELVNDLVSVMIYGRAAGVWLAAAVQHLNLLPDTLRQAIEANAKITRRQLGTSNPRRGARESIAPGIGGRTDVRDCGHVLITGGETADRTSTLRTLARAHADRGQLWLYGHDAHTAELWWDLVDHAVWFGTAGDLRDQVDDLLKAITARRDGSREDPSPVLLVIDELTGEHLADDRMVADLTTIVTGGHVADVWLAAAVDRPEMLPERLNRAFASNATINGLG